MAGADKAPMQCVPWGCGGIRRIGLVAARGIPARGRICMVHLKQQDLQTQQHYY